MTSRIIKVFIASPGDLTVERRAFKEVIDGLNKGYGRGARVIFEPLGWEDALSTFGRRSQSVINKDVDACDVFVLAMWRRWGQEAPDAAPYTSYTEEEFYRALARFEKDGQPTIFVFFKHIDPEQMADPGPQLAKVLAFRKQLEQTRKILYRPFQGDPEFRIEIDRHLVAFADGNVDRVPPDRATPIIPDSIQVEIAKYQADAQRAIQELENLRVEAKRAQQEAEQERAKSKDAIAGSDAAERVAEAKAALRSVTLAEDAAKAALDDRIEAARQSFAKALDGTTNIRVLSLGFEFFYRIGELDEAERLSRRTLAVSGPNAETSTTAAAYSNLGLVLQTRGDLDGAEEMYRKSLAIEEKLGLLEGMARGYGNLGVVLQTRGDLDGAEEMYRKSLGIDEKLGLLEGMARGYGNLGVVLQTRGDLEGAEEMHRKSLAIDEKLGRLEGIASDYRNLGNVLQTRGDLEGAEEMHRKSLAIEEKLGRLEGIASDYRNLGNVLQTRGDLKGAEEMHRKSLAINEKLGRLEGIASDYGNLGIVLQTRGDRDGARALWTKSRDLFAKIGMNQMVDRVQTWIDGLNS